MHEHHDDAEFTESAPLAIVDSSSLCLPTVSPADAKLAMQKYQDICEAVLGPDDYQDFEQWDPKLKRRVKRRFKKKSAVKKLQTFWGIDVKVSEIQRDELADGHFGFRCVATATDKNGRSVQATGACSTYEDRFDVSRKDDETDDRYAFRCKAARARSYHDVLSTAETRSTNRSVMNLIGVGGGEVTADEVQRPPRDAAPREAPKPAPQPQVHPVAEIAREAFELAKMLKLVPDDTVIFREWKKEKYPGLGWDVVLSSLKDMRKAKESFESLEAPTERELGAALPSSPPDEPEESEADRERMHKRVFALCREKRIDDEARHERTRQLYAKSSIKELTNAQVADFIEHLEGIR